MQEKDITSKGYFQEEARTADLVNVAIFHGKQVVKPGDIEEADSAGFHLNEYIVQKKKQKNGMVKFRDVFQKVIFGCRFLMIGIENQDLIHFAMPVRVMGYDYQSYEKQVRKIRKKHHCNKELKGNAEFLSGFSAEDYLEPVITIVLYYGKEPWTGPKCLKDMLRVEDFPEELREYVNDYPLHIIEVAQYEKFELFQTDLKLVFGCLKYQEDKAKWKEFIKRNQEAFNELAEDAYDMIAAYSHADVLTTVKETNQEGEKVSMCKALEMMQEEARAEGKAEGKAEGINIGEKRGEKRGERRGLKIGKKIGLKLGIEQGIQLFILDNQEEGVEPQRIRQKLSRRFRITAEQAEEYYRKYAE